MLEVCTEDWRCVCVCTGVTHAGSVYRGLEEGVYVCVYMQYMWKQGLLLHMLSCHVGARYQIGVLCKSSQ